MSGAGQLLAKAEQAAESARALLERGDLDGATNRAYYAAFHAARAALTHLDALPDGTKTHSTVIGLFGRHLVQAGLLDSSLGRALNRSHQLRNLTDYDVGSIDAEKVEQAIRDAERLIAAVRALTASPG